MAHNFDDPAYQVLSEVFEGLFSHVKIEPGDGETAHARITSPYGDWIVSIARAPADVAKVTKTEKVEA